MPTLPVLDNNILLVALVLFSGLCLLSLFIIAYQLVHKLRKVEIERDILKKDIEHSSELALEEAHKQSLAIVSHAQDKAQQIISDTKQFQTDAARIFQTELNDVTSSQSQELQETSHTLMQEYEQSLAKAKDEDINLFKNITKNIEKEVSVDLNEFKDVLEKETVASRKVVEDKLQAEYSQVSQEVATYKKDQLATVDKKIIELLEKSTELALKKSLSLKDHHELVLEALEEAKKETGL